MKRVEVPKELIEDFETGVSMTQLSQKYGISRPTVRLRLLELGYETSDKHTEEEIILYHQMNQEGFTWEEIARILNKKNPKGLSKSVRRRGLKVLDNRRKYKINHNFFSEYSPLSSYIAGFIAADGCITSDNKKLVISLGETEKAFLDRIIGYISPGRKSIKSQNGWQVSFYSEQIVSDLKNKYGIAPRKSYNYVPLTDIIPKEFLSYFWLGMFDGDGSISFSEIAGSNGYILPTVSLTGTTETILAFRKYLGKENVSYRSRHPERDNNNATFSLTGINNIKMVYGKLYNDTSKVFAMERKLDKFEYIISYSRP